MIIRKPRADEIDMVLILAEYYRDEAMLKSYDSDVVAETVKSLIVQPDLCLFCAYDNGRMVGLVAGMLIPSLWSQELVAHLQFLFLLPSHRNLVNGQRLVEEFESWAKNNHCDKITTGDIGIDVNRSRVFYKEMGFADTGCWLEKELSL